MQDVQRHAQGRTFIADLATGFGVTTEQADAVMRTVMPDLTWHLQRNTLSVGGLADLIEALGSGHHARYLDRSDVFRDPAAVADGNAILGHVLGSKDRSRTLAARAARQAGLSDDLVRSMLPGLAVITMARLAARAKRGLDEVTRTIPPGGLGGSSPYADLAAALRRRSGLGRYASGTLRHMVRWLIAKAAGFQSRGPVRWYADFMMIRPVQALARRVMRRMTT
jgi:hypothetical protein